jgi:dinuclear metal center YbgI/SA1388 family protein
MTIRDITSYLEELAPLQYAEDFDNVGLLVGNYNTTVTGVLVTLDTLEIIVDEAIEKKCNLIISFHPIIFSGLKKINGNNYVEKVVLKAIKNDIAIYSPHTALDNSIKGVSAKMASILKLNNTKILLPKKGLIKKLTTYVPEKDAERVKKALFKSGAGAIGNYDQCSFNLKGFGTFLGNENSNPKIGNKGILQTENEIQISVIFPKHIENSVLKALFESHPYEEVAYEILTTDNYHQHIGLGIVGELSKEINEREFLIELKNKFNLKNIRHSDLLDKPVRKVAVLGGSGSFAIEASKKCGADLYVSADFKYHDFFRAENQIVLVDIGHYESEQFTKNLIVDYLTKKFLNFAVVLSGNNTNPINYF